MFVIDCLRVTQISHTTRQIRAARGPYYTIKKPEIAEDRPPAAPAHVLSAIEQSISRIRTARPCSFVFERTKSSIVNNLYSDQFGALRANSPRVRVNKPVAEIVSMAMYHRAYLQGEPEHDEPSA